MKSNPPFTSAEFPAETTTSAFPGGDKEAQVSSALDATQARSRPLCACDIFSCVEKFPKFENYFTEKLAALDEIERKITDKKLRLRGENLKVLNSRREYYIACINNVISWLVKRNQYDN